MALTTSSTSSMNTTANMATLSRDQILYRSAGAIVAAIVVGVIILFTLVLITLKMYNRHSRTEREFGSQNTNLTKSRKTPSATGKNSVGSQPPTVISMPVDIHLENR